MLRHCLHALAQNTRRACFDAALLQLPGYLRLQARLRRGRTQRTFCAWAFVACVLRWRTMRARLRVLAAWSALRRQAAARLVTAAKHRAITLRGRAWSAWRAEYLRVSILVLLLGS